MSTALPISVLMPVYNAQNTLRQAIWSVLNQSVENFELLIYLDGPTDDSKKIITAFSDPRIKIFEGTENKGIVFARNYLVQKARGKYLAWLDADDYMLPGRLASQYNYLEVHSDVFMVGTAVEVRNDKKVKSVSWPGNAEQIKAWLFFRNPLVQSSLMFRNKKSLIEYDAQFEYLEDYAFYCQIFLKEKIAVMPQKGCTYYQDNQNALIHKYRKYDFVGKLETLMQRNFALLDLNPGRNELSLIREFLRSNHKIKPEDAQIIRKFLANARKQNRDKKLFQTAAFESVIHYQLLRLAKNAGIFKSGALLFMLLHPFKTIGAIFAGPKYK